MLWNGEVWMVQNYTIIGREYHTGSLMVVKFDLHADI